MGNLNAEKKPFIWKETWVHCADFCFANSIYNQQSLARSWGQRKEWWFDLTCIIIIVLSCQIGVLKQSLIQLSGICGSSTEREWEVNAIKNWSYKENREIVVRELPIFAPLQGGTLPLFWRCESWATPSLNPKDCCSPAPSGTPSQPPGWWLASDLGMFPHLKLCRLSGSTASFVQANTTGKQADTPVF